MARSRSLIEPKLHATKEIVLEILRAGASLVVETIEATHELRARRLVSGWLPEWEEYYPSSIDRQLTRLWRKGLVDVQETEEGHIITISDHGKTEVLRYDLNHIEIPIQKPWDTKWRMVIFDIPGEKEDVRALFRNHLKSMGFFQMQKSVYVHPYPCDKQIQYLREVYGIPHSVKLATILSLENDEDLRKMFGL